MKFADNTNLSEIKIMNVFVLMFETDLVSGVAKKFWVVGSSRAKLS
jgi:hypothetical protein